MSEGSGGRDPDPDDRSNERLLSHCPVIVRRRVSWGECDPAKVVYTPRFADYLAAAYFWFGRIVLADTLKLNDGSRLATPMKALTLEFHHVLRPDDLFDMTVGVVEIRTRTFDVLVTARSPDGAPRFVGRMTPIAIDANFHGVPLPPSARDALFAYRQTCTE